MSQHPLLTSLAHSRGMWSTDGGVPQEDPEGWADVWGGGGRGRALTASSQGGILAVSKQFVKEAKGIIRGCRKAGTIVGSGKGDEGPDLCLLRTQPKV